MRRDTAYFLVSLLATGACLVKSSLTTSAAAPHVAHPTLPPALRRSERVAGYLSLAVTLDALLHLFVDLAQRQAAGAFYFVGIWLVCHSKGLFLMNRLDLDTYGRSRQARGSGLRGSVLATAETSLSNASIAVSAVRN